MSVLFRQNAQKCRHMDFERPSKWRPNWHPQNAIKRICLAIWTSQEDPQNGALLGYILCANMAPAGGSDFGLQIDFLRFGDVPLGAECGQGFRIDTATFVSILSKQNLHFF